MRGTKLENARETYSDYLERDIRKIRSSTKTHPSVYASVSFSYRVLGICELFLVGNRTLLMENLSKSGQARLAFLEAVSKEVSVEEKYLCLSKDVGFMSSLAAGNVDLSVEIASKSPQAHFADVEYEDDFLFVHIVQQLLVGHLQIDEIEAKLQRWGSVLAGQESAKLDTIRAIYESDAGKVSENLIKCCEEYVIASDEYKNRIDFNPEIYATEGGIFIDGLAILRLAELKGIHLEVDHRLLPLIARNLPPCNLQRDSWKSVAT